MKRIILLFTCSFMLVFYGCDDSSNVLNILDEASDSFVFVANEGDFNSPGSGSISYIDQRGVVKSLESLGSTVHSVEVFEDMLLVSVNGDQKILIYSISEFGLVLQQEILTDGQSPRDVMVYNGKAYFPTWDQDWYVYPTIPGFIKVLDLSTFEITESIEVGIMPEGMLVKDGYLWVANSGESSVSKINLSSNTVDMNYSVGSGPQFLTELSGNIYIARTFYDQNWNPAYGTSMISSGEVSEVVHQFSAGSACGGSIMTLDNKVYRSFDGGIAQIDSNLEIDELSRIGSFNQSNVYHVETFNGNIYFAITDYGNLNKLSILNQSGDELSTFNVGKNPGDFAFWHK